MNCSVTISFVNQLLSNSRYLGYLENFYKGDQDVLITFVY